MTGVGAWQGLLLAGGFGWLCGMAFCLGEMLFFSCRRPPILRFLADVLFCLLAGTAWFLFLLATGNGHGRWYLYGGAAVGFLGWHQTFGCRLIALSRRLRRWAANVKRRLSNRIEHLFVKSSKKLKNICAKIHLFCKNLLQPVVHLLYNKHGYSQNRVRDGLRKRRRGNAGKKA